MTETSTKPYLIRAIYEWCVDNGYTPYVSVSVNSKTQVPRAHVKAGEIVLNVSELATQGLQMGNDWIEFQARFGGVAQQISVPIDQVNAIFARENGQGMAFEVPKPLAEMDEVEDNLSDSELDETSARVTSLSSVPLPVDESEEQVDPVESVGDTESKKDEVAEKPTESKKVEKKSTGKRKNHLTRVK